MPSVEVLLCLLIEDDGKGEFGVFLVFEDASIARRFSWNGAEFGFIDGGGILFLQTALGCGKTRGQLCQLLNAIR